MPELWKKHDRNLQLVQGSVFAVATLVSKDSSRINWNYYVLDEAVGNAVLRAISRQVSCKLSLVDADGKLVSVERFDPRNDRIPYLKDDQGDHPNWWHCFLLMAWGEDNTPPFYGLTLLMPPVPDKYVPRLTFVAPLLFGDAGWSGAFLYVPKFMIPRKVKLSLDELKKVAKVKCELTFRAGNDEKIK
jgi:hypothetical protein